MHTILIQRVLNYCYPYVQGRPTPKCKNIETLKIIALHPYHTPQGGECFSKTTHNMHYKYTQGMSTFLFILLFFEIIKSRLTAKSFDSIIINTNLCDAVHHIIGLQYRSFSYLKVSHTSFVFKNEISATFHHYAIYSDHTNLVKNLFPIV